MMMAPLVAIRCITYNHVEYIKQCLDGFVLQKTTFPYVVIIHDDCSTDGTTDIVRDYAQRYPDIIKPIFETENQRSKPGNPLRQIMDNAMNNTGAKYIALCEGDDYWTDPLKLQKQVDFLEEHEDYSMCTHAALWDRDGELFKEGCQYGEERALSTDEVIRYGGLYLATASLVFRKELSDDWPKWRKLSDVGDYPLQILGTLRGGLWFFPEHMCVYRFQHAGSWTNKDKLAGIIVNHLKTEITWLEILDEETHFRYSDAIYYHLIPFYSQLYKEKQLSFAEYYKAFKKTSVFSNKRFVKDVVINNFNWLYKLIKQ